MKYLFTLIILAFTSLAMAGPCNLFLEARVGSVIEDTAQTGDGHLPFNGDAGLSCGGDYFAVDAGGGHRSNADLDGGEYNNEYLFVGPSLFLPLRNHNRLYVDARIGKIVRNETESDGQYPYWFGAGIEHSFNGAYVGFGYLRRETKGSSRNLSSPGLNVRFNF